MAISRSNKDQEKRLEQIKRQLYGKEKIVGDRVQVTTRQGTTGLKLNLNHLATINAQPINHETHYLRKDLLKILLLAIFMIAIQLSLKFVLKI